MAQTARCEAFAIGGGFRASRRRRTGELLDIPKHFLRHGEQFAPLVTIGQHGPREGYPRVESGDRVTHDDAGGWREGREGMENVLKSPM